MSVFMYDKKKRIKTPKHTNGLGLVHLILVLKEQEGCLKLFTYWINWENLYAAACWMSWKS